MKTDFILLKYIGFCVVDVLLLLLSHCSLFKNDVGLDSSIAPIVLGDVIDSFDSLVLLSVDE